MADSNASIEQRRVAWLHMQRALRLPAQLTFYAASMGALLIMLPNDAIGLISGLGVNLLSGLLDRIARGEHIPDDEINTQVKQALEQTNIAAALQVADTQSLIARQFRRFDLLEYAIQQGEYTLVGLLTAQAEQYTAFMDEVRSELAQVDEKLDLLVSGQDALMSLIRRALSVDAVPVIQPKARLFLSYARADDEAFVKRLYDNLSEREFEVWWDRVSMPSRGLTFSQEIRGAIDTVDRLVLVVGPGALKSNYVREEWKYALGICKPVNVILRLEDGSCLPDVLRGPDYRDFRQDAHFEVELKRLIEQLQETPAPVGSCPNVPILPSPYLLRTEELTVLKQQLLGKRKEHILITDVGRKIGVWGMGGTGKSVLVAAAARDCEVRRAFPDGVIWITLGKDDINLIARQMQLADALNDHPQLFSDVQAGRTHLCKLLENKSCLIILDDVWQAVHAEAFDVLGPGCCLLITTRDEGIVTALGAKGVPLDVLSPNAALSLLADWTGQPVAELPKQAREIVEECGCLPLALAMVGAMLKGKPSRWDNVLHKLQSADLDRIGHEFLHYRYRNLMSAIQVSVDALDDIEDLTALMPKTRYLEMSVFPADTPIPEAALITYWELLGLSRFNIEDLLDTFVQRSLARRDANNNLTLHDLQFDYIGTYVENLSALHERLLMAYKQKCSNGWHSGPNDGYFFERLAYHLRAAGRYTELYNLLIGDPDWMEAKFIACVGDNSYMADLGMVIRDFADPLSSNHLLLLSQLHAAQQVVHSRVNIYNDMSLKTLVWLGREQEALNHARLRGASWAIFDGLMAIHEAQQEQRRANLTLLNEALRVARNIDNEWTRAEALGKLAAALVRIGDSRALSIFEEAKAAAHCEQNEGGKSGALQKLAAVLAQLELYEEARAVADSIQIKSSRVEALLDLAVVLTQVGDARSHSIFDEAETVAYSIQDDWYREWSLSDLAKSLANAGHIDRVENVIRNVQAEYWQAQTLLVLARVLVQTDTDRSLAVFAKTETVARGIQDEYRRETTLGDLAEALAKARQFERAKTVANAIQSTYERGNAMEALGISLALVGKDEEAKVLFSMQEEWKQSWILYSLTKELAKEGLFEKAEEVAHSIQNWERQSDAFQILVTAYIGAGQYEKAQAIARNIQGLYQRAEALQSVAAYMARAGNIRAYESYKEAEVAIRNTQNESHYAEALHALTATLAQSNDNRCHTMFPEVEVAAQSIQDEAQRARALRNLAVVLNQAESERCHIVFEDAEVAAHSIQDEAQRARALCDLAVSLAQTGNDRCRTVLKETETVVRSIQGESRRAGVLCDLATALAQTDYDWASAVFEEAEITARNIQDERSQAEALQALVIALTQARQFDKAYKIAHDIQVEMFSAESLRNLVVELCQNERYDQACEVAYSISEKWYRAFALRELAIALLKTEKFRALSLLSEVEHLAHEIQDETCKSSALSLLAAALTPIDKDRAISLLTEAKEFRGRIDGSGEGIFANGMLALSLVKLGRVKEAQEILYEIPSNVGQGIGNDQMNANRIFQAILDYFVDTKTWTEALSALNGCHLNRLLMYWIEWRNSVESVESGLSLEILVEVLRIINWIHPAWKKVYEILSVGATQA